MVDVLGHPILPTNYVTYLKSQQDVIYEIFTKAYSKFIFSYLTMIFWSLSVRVTKHNNIHISWLELARTPTKYLDIDTLPEGFEVLDPLKMTKRMIS